MPRKPLPPELDRAQWTHEALRDLAGKLGQFEDNKAWKRRSGPPTEAA